MSTSEPPVVSTWLLERPAPIHQRESLIGDLREQYHEGRSGWWYRRQAFVTIVVIVTDDIFSQKLLAIRALISACAAIVLLQIGYGALRHAVIIQWHLAPRQPEFLRQAVVYYGLPFEPAMCLGCAVIGWLIARQHRGGRASMVVLSALAPWLWAFPWAWQTTRLWNAGLWPFWDFRFALLFHGALIVVAYPLCIVLGGLWAAPPDLISRASNRA